MRISRLMLFLLTFLVEVLLVLGTGRMSGCGTRPWRTAAAGMLEALYGTACLLPGLGFLGSFFCRLVALAVLGAVAFGWDRDARRGWGILAALHLALEGAALLAVREDYRGFLPAVAVVWLLGTAALGDAPEGERYVPLELRREGKTLRLLALRDTGNRLRDPVTGEPVLVISPEAAGTLTGLTREQLRCPLETIVSRPLPGLRLVPCRTVSGSGLLLAMALDVKLGSKDRTALVAFAPESFGSGGAVQALTGGDI